MPVRMTLRAATVDDVPQILAFIRALADYERLLHEVEATEDGLRRALFGPRPYAEVVLAEDAGAPVGFALFFHTFSTFLGRPGIYLEDLFVVPEARGRGVGRALLAHLARLAGERGLRPGRVGGARLERSGDPLLRQPGGPAQRRVDRLPPDRGCPDRPGRREIIGVTRRSARRLPSLMEMGRTGGRVTSAGSTARASARKPFRFGGRPVIMGPPVVSATDRALPMDSPRPAPGPPRQPPADGIDAASTIELLALVKENQSEEAVNVLFGRYLPRITRWARGRLPRYARNMLDTDDLVQDTVFQTLKRLQSFEVRHEGALQGYLRTAVVNRIRDEVRRATRHPGAQSLHEDGHVDAAASPLEEAIGGQAVARYERAMDKLSEDERQAIVLRVELQLPYAQIAEEMRKPSPDAARMAVARALVRLAEEMGHEG